MKSPLEGLNVEPFKLEAISALARALSIHTPPVCITGVHSSAPFALLLSQTSSERLVKNPHVVVTANQEIAENLLTSLQFFDPIRAAHILPAFDMGPYSGLYPSPRIVAARLKWIYHAANAKPGEIFIASAEALMQKTLPFSIFTAAIRSIQRNTELPKDLSSYLNSIGYTGAPTVEDVGSFAIRGGVVDIFSPAHERPVRIELFGDLVESMRFFDPATQLSVGDATSFELLPAREVLYSDDNRQNIAKAVKKSAEGRPVQKDEIAELTRSIAQGQPFYGIEYLLPYFYQRPDSPLNYFSGAIDYWIFDELETVRAADEVLSQLKNAFAEAEAHSLRIPYQLLYSQFDQFELPEETTEIHVNKSLQGSEVNDEEPAVEFNSFSVQEFAAAAHGQADPDALAEYIKTKIKEWHGLHYRVFICCQGHASAERIRLVLEGVDISSFLIDEQNYAWSQINEQAISSIGLIVRKLPDSFRAPDERIIFLRDEDIWSRRKLKRQHTRLNTETEELERTQALSFGDLKPGDFVVHRTHGVGHYQGLKVMSIEGADAEFIELTYREGDRLYLPVYRVGQLHKYVGPSGEHMIDKLGGPGWAKAKTKVRNQLRDIASKLLKLYAKRANLSRPSYGAPDNDFSEFENAFPYQETDDQLRAVADILGDLQTDKPMDRLICGDVGFGKTEIAMRATFKVVQERKQVAVVAPTTILTFQHYENFKKRFAGWPVEIRALNRFVSAKDIKKTIQELKEGKVDIVIGTHRLLSRDIAFKDLGLLVLDEEQKFGVAHKERLRHMRESVDTLAMSATPIPRTLNMSLVGIRDMSLINTPPEDRLPTRTFVVKSDDETIRKAIESEISRGGQVFFLHNRVQTIDEVCARIRAVAPSARIAVAHGQMEEESLEKTMMRFFHHEIDVLVCTAIIESGMDIARANTILIDNAHTFGLSQLYQLRGRVGRSKDRAYCYLLLPAEKRIDAVAQERLKIIQENTALGSGIRVAQYDLELRGSGDILGEDQSGHINAVGYELYLELLEEAVHEQKGETPPEAELEPEINLRISALLPDAYIPDIRMRLYYYKMLSQIRSEDDVNKIEQEMRDQFGPPPEPVFNLLGLMYIRRLCRDLGVKDIISGKNALTLSFTDRTTLPTAEIIRLTTRENKKFQLTPDQRLKIRMNDVTWPRVVDELMALINLCPKTEMLKTPGLAR